MGVWVPNIPIGEITYPLSNNYNYIDVIFSNPINSGNVNLYIDNVFKMSTTGAQTITYSGSYTTGQILKIDETNTAIIGKNLIIKLSRSQSQYSITFQEETECDILIVGGGGAGGGNGQGGGGGSGALIYVKNKILNGNYTINVGRGGIPVNVQNRGDNGVDTTIIKDASNLYVSKGGGGGGTWITANFLSQDGGSGGGGAGNGLGGNIVSGNIIDGVAITISGTNYNNSSYTDNLGINSLNDTGCFGNKGGDEVDGGLVNWGAGGGGAGEVGLPTTETVNNDISGDGGSGKKYDITGTSTYYAGGGGGGLRPRTDFTETS